MLGARQGTGVPLAILVCKSVFNETDESVDSICLITAVSDNGDGSALGDSEGKDTEKALRVYAAILLFNPDGSLEGICLLDEEGCGSCVKTYVIANRKYTKKYYDIVVIEYSASIPVVEIATFGQIDKLMVNANVSSITNNY